MRENSCKHFIGFSRSETCEAGVNLLALVGGERLGMALRLPCSGCDDSARLKELNLSRVECPKFEKVTPEEVAAERAAVDRLVERMKKTGPWISAMKKKHKPGYASSDVCPICSKTIRFSIAKYNGHMHARCETPDCVNFME